ncbi:MAG TPA: phage major capsid protein [Mycobacterium sp.]|jgi:HK97 family phage major capsid protein
MGTPTAEYLSELRGKTDAARDAVEGYLTSIAEMRGHDAELMPDEQRRLRTLAGDYRSLESTTRTYASELARCGTIPANLQQRAEGAARTVRSGAYVAPMDFDRDELRRAHQRLREGESVRLEARAFTSASGELPAELAPWVTAPVHPDRILDRLPAMALDMPAIEVVQINSVTGTAGYVGEGQLKPEITPVVTPLTITAKKIACHVGLSYEALADFDLFVAAVRTEAMRQTIDAENHGILYGTGTGLELNGLTTTAGILTADATGASQPIDAIESAIAQMRTGPALAVCDLIITNPETFSAIRQTKDTMGRYLLSADPTAAEASTIWGTEVVQTVVCTPGEAVLLDTSKFGRAVVREPLSMRIGWANDDFVRNILRTVSETRLNVSTERPSAVLWLKSLPTAPATTKVTKK